MMAAEIDTDDDPGNLSTQTSALLNRPVGGARGGGGMGNYTAPKVTPRDYTAGFRAMGYSDPAGERPGQHQVQTPEGRAPHGSDVPGTGVPAPAAPTDAGGVPGGAASAGDAAGGAEAAGATAGLEELAPLALAL
jgi:hypothetical protein